MQGKHGGTVDLAGIFAVVLPLLVALGVVVVVLVGVVVLVVVGGFLFLATTTVQISETANAFIILLFL
jgi:hypothetical protein